MKKYLHYYAFDWDDNILIMPTILHMDYFDGHKWIKKDISTKEFSEVRNDTERWRMNKDTYVEFSDNGKYGINTFLHDCKKAIENKSFGASWKDFIECITNGSIFAIITARNNSAEAIKKALHYIITDIFTDTQYTTMIKNLKKFHKMFIGDDVPSDNILIDNYLDNCRYMCVNSKKFLDEVGKSADTSTEELKKIAFRKFQEYINAYAKKVDKKAMLGFSDDDDANISSMTSLIKSINNEDFSNIMKYHIKNTKNPSHIITHIKDFNESSNPSNGLESSILPFTQYSMNMMKLTKPNDTIKDTERFNYLHSLLSDKNMMSKMEQVSDYLQLPIDYDGSINFKGVNIKVDGETYIIKYNNKLYKCNSLSELKRFIRKIFA